MSKKRLYYIDFIKFIGLTGIIVAHVGSPNWVLMLRSFDVPLMVIISSILASISIEKYKDTPKDNLNYCISRIKRLVIPTWIFLTIFFIIKFLVTKEFLGIEYYLATFLLTRYGYGYVWIILIYLYSSMLVPIFRKIGYSTITTIIILIIYVIYEILFINQIGTDYKIIETTFYYIIPYGLLTYIGFNYNKINNTKKISCIFISLILFILLAYYYFTSTGSFQLVQTVKYPPRIYYLSYGIACSFALLLLCENINLKIFKSKIINFISKHSMWIYLWHILVLEIYDYIKLPEIWYLKFLIVYAVTIVIVIVVNKILDIIETKHKFKIFKYLRG